MRWERAPVSAPHHSDLTGARGGAAWRTLAMCTEAPEFTGRGAFGAGGGDGRGEACWLRERGWQLKQGDTVVQNQSGPPCVRWCVCVLGA